MFVILVCVLLCKGSAFMLVGQELRWFLLVLLRLNACGLCFGMVFVLCLAVWHTKKGMIGFCCTLAADEA